MVWMENISLTFTPSKSKCHRRTLKPGCRTCRCMLDFMGSGSKLDSIQEKVDENGRERYCLGVWNDLRLVDLYLFVDILVFAQFWIVLEEAHLFMETELR